MKLSQSAFRLAREAEDMEEHHRRVVEDLDRRCMDAAKQLAAKDVALAACIDALEGSLRWSPYRGEVMETDHLRALRHALELARKAVKP